MRAGQRATSGVVLTIDNADQLVLAEGLVRREDVPAGQTGRRRRGRGGQDGRGTEEGSAEFSATLAQNLTAHRSAAVGRADPAAGSGPCAADDP